MNFTFKYKIYYLFTHIIKIFIQLLRKKTFIPISLPFFSNQIFYNRYNKKFFKFKIRDHIDYRVVNQIFNDENYSLQKFRRYKEIKKYYDNAVKKNLKPLILDCGGHIGLATKYFSITYPHSKLILIEPEKENFNQSKNNNLNNSNVEFINGAIGSENAKCKIFDPKIGNWGYRVNKKNKGNGNIFSVNHILNKFKKKYVIPFIIKIDIEGFENELFSKNIKQIDIFPIIIIELHDWMLPGTSNSRNFLRAISKKDRDFLYSGENIFSVINKKKFDKFF